MIYCEYNKYFAKIRQENRVVSIPILKNTCIHCKYNNECHMTKLHNTRKNNEFLITNFLELRDYIKECLNEYGRIEKDIEAGLYDESYTYRFIKLNEVPNKAEAVIHKTDECGEVDQCTVEEYLTLYPNESTKKRLVGIHKVKEVSDVCYGLNKVELEKDLEYINNQLKYYNKNNKINTKE